MLGYPLLILKEFGGMGEGRVAPCLERRRREIFSLKPRERKKKKL
jgi:hypothetical protein